MATSENLRNAFSGESQANRKYLAFAKKAEAEGYPMIARIFRAAAQGETVHAMAHLRAMKAVRGTRENLDEAIQGENAEFKEMYPRFIEEARNEQAKQALTSFQNAMAVEQVHHSLYIEARDAVKAGRDMAVKKVFVCSVCGNAVLDEAPENCPVCGSPRAKFTEID